MMATDTGIASGAIANCTDGADEVPIVKWEAQARSFSGVSSVVCNHGKKNLIPLNDWYAVGDSVVSSGVRFTFVENGGIRITGKTTLTTYSQLVLTSYTLTPVTSWQLYVPNGTYSFSLTGITSYIRLITSGSSANGFPYSEVTYANQTRTGAVKDSTKPFSYLFIRVYPTESDVDVTVYPQLEVGSSSSSYEKYSTPETQTATLGRTVYGAKLNLTSGTGTENMVRVKISDLSWTYYTGGTNPIFYATNVPNMKTYARAEMPNIAIDGYTTRTAHSRSNLSTNMANMECSAIENAQTITFRNDTYTSRDDMLAAIGDTYIIYETTQTTDFTFSSISKPVTWGVDNFWIDSGDSEVEYYKSGYGYTSVTLNRPTSKNLFNVNKIIGNGYFDTSGVWNPTTSYNAYSFRCNPSMTFTRQGNFAGIVTYWGISGNFLSAINQGSGSVKTFTTPENCYEFRLSIPIANLDGTQMVEVGESASTYEAYSAVTKTAKLHRLIYEGSVDVIRGIGTISVGESGTEYDPPEAFTFPPVSFDTIEGEQFLFASEGASALTYRKAVDS